ncbi:C40 family peptidase [Streptomyces stramineus]
MRRPRGPRGGGGRGGAGRAGDGHLLGDARVPVGPHRPGDGHPGGLHGPRAHDPGRHSRRRAAGRAPEPPAWDTGGLPDPFEEAAPGRDGELVLVDLGGTERGRGSARLPEAAPGRDLEPAVAYALAQVGDAYALGGNGPRRWDCSGLVQQAYRKAGVRLPRIAADQYRATAPVKRGSLRRGDLVFWTSNGRVSGIHHVAVYLGGGRYVEAPRPGKKVRISTFSHYSPNLYGRIR